MTHDFEIHENIIYIYDVHIICIYIMYLISKGVEIEKRGGEKKSLRGGNDFFNKITLCEF